VTRRTHFARTFWRATTTLQANARYFGNVSLEKWLCDQNI